MFSVGLENDIVSEDVKKGTSQHIPPSPRKAQSKHQGKEIEIEGGRSP